MSDEEDLNEENENAEGAGGGENFDGEGGEGEGGGSKKLFLIIGLLVVLLFGGAAAAYFTGMLDSVLGKEPEMHCETDEHGEEHCEEVHVEEDHGSDDHGGGHGGGHGEEGAGGNFVEIPTILVNLSTDDGAPRYLRLTVQLELENPADRGSVEAVMPRVVDQFQTYLRELRVKDLRGSAGIYRLQMELLWRVNQAAAPVKVKDVLFQEILIQ